ncbi:sugar diacid recognition domain-containing protein [Paraburkholderia sabiae]|uniref:Sugar diacid recognition domain-containing protein n=1 Tax=Paraburkholderia sabiae TaxID=273251 RepID=A0ABU9QKC4_9BURK|nr:sugar diacid recognition domain-containing protein [Paraburkholderia sabiae]WJZ76520.1 sugar diacid recognition domain-containing protein [Paraburkholderia sabiae]CAD6560321.1 Carbohydrate diacid regulator [Paraburkholderia sabiae]
MNGRIDSRLAAQIVEQVTNVLPFDINVMDAKGSVVASTDPTRVGTFHSGAQMVLGSSREVEIDDATAARITNVRPGVNLPLVVRGKLIGVVGLTGAPDEVRRFGKLLQGMAQLILEREQLTLELRREERHKEEFIRQAINERSESSREDLAAWAERLGIDLTVTRCAVLCRFTFNQTDQNALLSELEQVQAHLTAQRPDFMVARSSLSELAIFREFEVDAANPYQAAETAHKVLHEVKTLIASVCKRSFLLALGVALPNIDGLRQSWTCAINTLQAGEAQRSNGAGEHCFSYYDHRLAVLFSTLPDNWALAELLLPLRRLLDTERDAPLLQHTLNVWYEHEAHPTRTAKALGIHRNTLDYRLKKINDATGLNLSTFEDSVMMYIALRRMTCN